MPVPIVIVGAGGHAREICSYLEGHPTLQLLGVLDDFKPPGSFEQTEVLGPIECLAGLQRSNPGLRFITAFGDNLLRRAVMQRIERLTLTVPPAVIVDRSAQVGRAVKIGEGTLIAPGAIVTTRVRIGRHCIINVKASVSHDCEIADFANLNPGVTLCGSIRIGEGAYIGAGATVIGKASVGAWSIIGAGAVVIRDVPARVTSVGVPAKLLNRHQIHDST
jgi:acetyltransferase EpsM